MIRYTLVLHIHAHVCYHIYLKSTDIYLPIGSIPFETTQSCMEFILEHTQHCRYEPVMHEYVSIHLKSKLVTSLL